MCIPKGKLDRALIPADYVSVEKVEDVSEKLKRIFFPGGFSCYTSCHTVGEAEIIYNEVVVRQEYFRHGLSAAGAQCILDVGANIGIFTLFVKQIAPEAFVYAFEPMRETFQVLNENIRLHNCANVHSFNLAIGNQDHSEKTFTYFPNMPGNTTATPVLKVVQKVALDEIFGKELSEFLNQAELRTAQVRTISSIVRENGITNVDYLKIDVEGDEIAVLEGIEEQHWPFSRQVAIETHSERLRAQARVYLEGRQYQVFEDAGISSVLGDANLYARRG